MGGQGRRGRGSSAGDHPCVVVGQGVGVGINIALQQLVLPQVSHGCLRHGAAWLCLCVYQHILNDLVVLGTTK